MITAVFLLLLNYMTLKHKCDICGKILQGYGKSVYSSRFLYMADYCDKCWLKTENWEKIHKIPERSWQK
ncbi:hypothetical protein A3D00_02940 [Candidatus Woesebacteria bacterium RIFCSPHIGHO2_02_FULL_38_9]|uniref:Uncharacterized protein n=1 Tax=Candidatus Woesebacteria bacterium RIFCSPHIGHO2_01_FULL_39_28 TaxID=1802496 RepID=A0A1F7YI26_9BACT|nr:MAG: hypothetical protein A2627_03895 [Candidatus Woesebacteria bacterium RIFCSPHIGHO2_01_FULL_39_28]OGM35339.1 MAG: hypothetical protein A3D00_02940 [Candidatus Woesebacteria bacterium RIFCSPHIGHO2_02_FULL_38_9]OGM57235.1 MAG: hypothetical protein A3A50_00455 [Candidatus Woesebacteria bacterium RIFCSPLOWO2_01_FULL_38_20]